MTIQLNELEKKLQNLIEVHLIKYLPGQRMQDRVAQRFTEAIRTSLTTHELSKPIPHHIILTVHPSSLQQWQKDSRLLDGLTKIFRLATSEIGLQFDGIPVISLATDPTLETDNIIVRIARKEHITETDKIDGHNAAEPPTGKAAFLIVGGTKVFTVIDAVTNIGRRLDNHLVVDDPRVSRYHAQIRYTRGRFVIFDLNSTGGTFVNGQKVSQSVLYPGDVISLAGLPIVFGQDHPPSGLSSGETSPLSHSSSSANRNTAVLKPFDDNKNTK